MAKRFFSGRNPIGMHLCLDETFRMERAFEVIGVVKDAHYFGLREATEPMIYQAVWRPGVRSSSLAVRTGNDPRVLTETIRREVAALDAAIPVLGARTIAAEIDNNVMQEKIVATLSSFFGLLALVLASVGLYGVMAHAVARRTREIGIRMALGATAADVLWMVLRDGAQLTLLGLAIGFPLAAGLALFLSRVLVGVSPLDPLVFTLAPATLAAAAALATYVPARRATAVTPLEALRAE